MMQKNWQMQQKLSKDEMVMKYYLAVDIGASSGRHMLAHMENGKMYLEEVYRFKNGMENRNGNLLWDTKHLLKEIIAGMKQCKELNKVPVSMSVDTWAVDYVLLDEKDEILGETFGYRDHRTDGMDKEVFKKIDEKELYARTGIQKQHFNTIYQLMSVKMNDAQVFDKAKTFLMIPDYFHFLLTGNKMSEYTNATSTQLVDPVEKQWDKELIRILEYPQDIFLPLQTAGTVVGNLKEEVQKEVGYDCRVVMCASHDTASAVMAMPVVDEEGLYISSGTWSLMGVEREKVLCDENSRKTNMTNEGGYEYRFRYLKNIMGLWMIQSIRHEYDDSYTFSQLCELAEKKEDFKSRVDVNDNSFLSPVSMKAAIIQFCERTNQEVPSDAGEFAAVIYNSLAECYQKTVREIEKNVQQSFESIYVIGGGSNARYLNRLTANATGKTVYAGPDEATAIGNIMAQMLADGSFGSLPEARKCVYESFKIEKFVPEIMNDGENENEK